MKLQILFKTPDAGEHEIREYVGSRVDNILTKAGKDPALVTDEESEHLYKQEKQKVLKVLNQYIKYGEIVQIEFDIEKGKAEVVKL